MMTKLLLALTFTSFVYGQSLETLLENAKRQNLLLSESKDTIMIREEEVELADIWENPSLTLGANDLLVDDITSRDREPMQTHFVILSQKIPTAGKNDLRKSMAKVERDISDAAYAQMLAKILSRLSGFGYKVAIIDKKLALIEKYQRNVARVKNLQTKRFAVGMSIQSSIVKSKILAKKLLIKKRKLLTMKKAFLYKIETLSFQKVASVKVPLLMDKRVEIDLSNHPIMIASTLRVQKAKEEIKLQRSSKIPDVKLGVGYFQRVDRSDYLAFNVGFSLPIRGKEERKIKIALLKESQAKTVLKSKAFILQREVDTLKELMEDSLENYRIIKKEILPKQRYIHKLLEKEIFSKNTSATALLTNLNERIILELEAYDEMDSYFEAYAKLVYFEGGLSL
ncbi:MAG TPA: hypothetical protein EYG95_03795 [Campylobacterales bacterium]|nr:hypothetical protein [Campylobacterales bacterium]